MPAPHVDRTRTPARPRSRSTGVVRPAVLGVLLAAVLSGAVAAPAHADPVFAEGDCVVSLVSEGGPGGAQCAGVDLSGTRFGEADFRAANLTGASFADGDVQGAVFGGAVLDGADFSGARIVGADFTGSSILPGQLDLTADASGSAAVPIEAALPTGLTLDGCAIAGTPVESGQTFPIGTSTLLCTISSSFAGTASARITVNVTASPTSTPGAQPLFTAEPSTGPEGGEASADVDFIALGGVASVLVLLAGIAVMVVTASRRRAPRRASGRRVSGRRVSRRGRETG